MSRSLWLELARVADADAVAVAYDGAVAGDKSPLDDQARWPEFQRLRDLADQFRAEAEVAS